jgi:hypothetical protein
MPDGALLACTDSREGTERAWLSRYPVPKGAPAGFLVDGEGALVESAEPAWCNRWAVPHPLCPASGVCRKDHYSSGRSLAPHFSERFSLEEAGSGVALGYRTDPQQTSTDELVGYDPATTKVRWRQPVARERVPHAMPRVEVDLSGGQLISFYQTREGAWELAARDAPTGDPTWSTLPPRALEGTNFDSLTVTGQGLYLGLSNRLEVFDPGTGASRGVIW